MKELYREWKHTLCFKIRVVNFGVGPIFQLKRCTCSRFAPFPALLWLPDLWWFILSSVGLRIATFGGFIVSLFSFLVAIYYLVMKLLYWDRFIAGNIPILIGVFFLGGVQLFFIGLMEEYIMNINTRVMHRPLVIEEERINFETT